MSSCCLRVRRRDEQALSTWPALWRPPASVSGRLGVTMATHLPLRPKTLEGQWRQRAHQREVRRGEDCHPLEEATTTDQLRQNCTSAGRNKHTKDCWDTEWTHYKTNKQTHFGHSDLLWLRHLKWPGWRKTESWYLTIWALMDGSHKRNTSPKCKKWVSGQCGWRWSQGALTIRGGNHAWDLIVKLFKSHIAPLEKWRGRKREQPGAVETLPGLFSARSQDSVCCVPVNRQKEGAGPAIGILARL